MTPDTGHLTDAVGEALHRTGYDLSDDGAADLVQAAVAWTVRLGGVRTFPRSSTRPEGSTMSDQPDSAPVKVETAVEETVTAEAVPTTDPPVPGADAGKTEAQ